MVMGARRCVWVGRVSWFLGRHLLSGHSLRHLDGMFSEIGPSESPACMGRGLALRTTIAFTQWMRVLAVDNSLFMKRCRSFAGLFPSPQKGAGAGVLLQRTPLRLGSPGPFPRLPYSLYIRTYVCLYIEICRYLLPYKDIHIFTNIWTN